MLLRLLIVVCAAGVIRSDDPVQSQINTHNSDTDRLQSVLVERHRRGPKPKPKGKSGKDGKSGKGGKGGKGMGMGMGVNGQYSQNSNQGGQNQDGEYRGGGGGEAGGGDGMGAAGGDGQNQGGQDGGGQDRVGNEPTPAPTAVFVTPPMQPEDTQTATPSASTTSSPTTPTPTTPAPTSSAPTNKVVENLIITDAPTSSPTPTDENSCRGLCGSMTATCFCDGECQTNGDCCLDFAEFCTLTPTPSPFTTAPTKLPSTSPSVQPSSTHPSIGPTQRPTITPTTSSPTTTPTRHPTTASPTSIPTALPSTLPSVTPSSSTPTTSPSSSPSSSAPSTSPSTSPSSSAPSTSPSTSPSSATPSTSPSTSPSSSAPSTSPSHSPSSSVPSTTPSMAPSSSPTMQPTTSSPSSSPTISPTRSIPTFAPTTSHPSTSPTASPTRHACDDGSHGCDKSEFGVCIKVDVDPFHACACVATHHCSPSCDAENHTCEWTTVPPTASPTVLPSSLPTATPSDSPSAQPTRIPTTTPTATPSDSPSAQPTTPPTAQPSSNPTTSSPTSVPTAVPSTSPTFLPTPASQFVRVPSGLPRLTATSTELAFTTQYAIDDVYDAIKVKASFKLNSTLIGSASINIDPFVGFDTVTLTVTNFTIDPLLISGDYKLLVYIVPRNDSSEDYLGWDDKLASVVIKDIQVFPPDTTVSPTTSAPTTSPTPAPTSSSPTVNPSTTPSRAPSSPPTTPPTRVPTSAPTTPTPTTSTPTSSPTALPTRHACDDGSHGCDVSEFGVCSKIAEAPFYSCGCVGTHQCLPSCDVPDHTCVLTPTTTPTAIPSAHPSVPPTAIPTTTPSSKPTAHPSATPSAAPSVNPSAAPSAQPSVQPSSKPTTLPSQFPTATPSAGPTSQPATSSPTKLPTKLPSSSPTHTPSDVPTSIPSLSPTTRAPTTPIPTTSPTTPSPTTRSPTISPSSGVSSSCVGICDSQASGGCYCDSLCSDNGDCCTDYQQECVATTAATTRSPTAEVVATTGSSSTQGGGVKGGTSFCDADVHGDGDTTCAAGATATQSIESSENFVLQNCNQIVVDNTTLFLLLRPTCRTDGQTTVDGWDVCSYQPTAGSNLLCSALGNLQCCDELHVFLNAQGIPSASDISCTKYQPGECHEINGYNGFSMQSYNVKLSGCAGEAKAAKCAAQQTADSSFFASLNQPASLELLGMGFVLLAVGLVVRRRNRENSSRDRRLREYTKTSASGPSVLASVTAPFKQQCVPSQTSRLDDDDNDDHDQSQSLVASALGALDVSFDVERHTYEPLVDWDDCDSVELEARPLLR
eukprot:m.139355 g.139355  ORF g.139355 m.139355 type:complete len:1313 (+) comp30050_c1_seq5:251-4189(+)